VKNVKFSEIRDFCHSNAFTATYIITFTIGDESPVYTGEVWNVCERVCVTAMPMGESLSSHAR